MIKHGLIRDADFVAWIDQNADKLLELDSEALEFGLYHGCRIKSIVVSQDERENNLRAILNLGHTIGHALEAVADYNELLHGEAISIGMVGAARLAVYWEIQSIFIRKPNGFCASLAYLFSCLSI